MDAHDWKSMTFIILGGVGLVWSDSNGDLSVVLLYFRQSKAAEVDLLFELSRKIWSRTSCFIHLRVYVSYSEQLTRKHSCYISEFQSKH